MRSRRGSTKIKTRALSFYMTHKIPKTLQQNEKKIAEEKSMLFSVLCLSGYLPPHLFPPVEISHGGNNCVECKEAGHGVESFPCVKAS